MHYHIHIKPEESINLNDAVVAAPVERSDFRLDNDAPRLIATHNQTGYITTFADPFVCAFIERAKIARGPVLELAAGYGLPSIAAMEAGCQDVTISDLDSAHLQYARSRPEFGKELKVLEGALPEHPGLPNDHFELIFLSRVLHFFDGPTVRKTLHNILKWLRPRGELIVVCDSVYQKQFEMFQQTYTERLASGHQWPGYFDNMNWVHAHRSAALPDCFHYFDVQTLVSALAETGFDVEIVSLFHRPEYPIEKKLDGRESIGAIARKSA